MKGKKKKWNRNEKRNSSDHLSSVKNYEEEDEELIYLTVKPPKYTQVLTKAKRNEEEIYEIPKRRGSLPVPERIKISLKEAIIEGDLDAVNDFVLWSKNVFTFFGPLSSDDASSIPIHSVDLAVKHDNRPIMRALIDHAIKESGVKKFIGLLRSCDIQHFDEVFRDLVSRYPVVAHALLDSYVQYRKLEGNFIFREALSFNPALFKDSGNFEALLTPGRGELLRHPLVESVSLLEWSFVRKLFFLGLAFKGVMTLCFSLFCLFGNKESGRNNSGTSIENNGGTLIFLYGSWIFVIFYTLYKVTEIIVLIYLKKRNYVLLLGNVLLFIFLLFPGLLIKSSYGRYFRTAAVIVLWLKLLSSVRRVPNQTGLYAFAFQRLCTTTILRVGMISGILFPSIGIFIGFVELYGYEKRGIWEYPIPLSAFLALGLVLILTITFFVSTLAVEIEKSVFSVNGENNIRETRIRNVILFKNILSFWTRRVFKEKFHYMDRIFVVLPRQFQNESQKPSWKEVFNRKLGLEIRQPDIHRVYCAKEEMDTLYFGDLKDTKCDLPSEIIERVYYHHKKRNQDICKKGYADLYWNQNYEYYETMEDVEGRNDEASYSENDYEIVEPINKTKYQLMKEAIITEIKRDYDIVPLRNKHEEEAKPDDKSVSVRPGLALGILTLQAGPLGKSRLELNQ